MDFSLSEEQQEVRDLARKILEDRCTPDRLKQVEASAEGVDLELWGDLARSNLLGVGLPERFGGSDLGFFTTCLLLEEIGRTVAPVPALSTLVMAALPIARFGSPEQQQRWLPGVVNGEIVLSAGLHEAGNDEPARPATSFRAVSGGYQIDGVKLCVPAAHLAQRVLVPARRADGQVGAFLVDPASSGVKLEPQRTTNRERHFQLTLASVRVGDEDRLGAADQGAEVVQWIADRATAATCALQLGVSDRALRMTATYAASRVQFERPIGSFQAVHTRAADAFIDVEAMRLTSWLAAWRLSQELPASDEVAVAKYWAAEGGQFVGYAAQHLHGGIGIDVDYPLHRYYLWAKQLELTLGSAPVQLARIGARMAREAVPAER
jgi:alkylation response protein AidB-like acyl-CoA dehydrogenase